MTAREQATQALEIVAHALQVQDVLESQLRTQLSLPSVRKYLIVGRLPPKRYCKPLDLPGILFAIRVP